MATITYQGMGHLWYRCQEKWPNDTVEGVTTSEADRIPLDCSHCLGDVNAHPMCYEFIIYTRFNFTGQSWCWTAVQRETTPGHTFEPANYCRLWFACCSVQYFMVVDESPRGIRFSLLRGNSSSITWAVYSNSPSGTSGDHH